LIPYAPHILRFLDSIYMEKDKWESKIDYFPIYFFFEIYSLF
jgi:hypothetical protein